MPITDLFTQATNGTRPLPTTLTAIRAVGAPTITCGALTGWPTLTAVHFIIYTTDTAGNKVAGSQLDCKGVVSGSTITNIVYKAGNDTGNTIGAIVEAAPTAAYANDIYTGVTAEHTVLGVHNVTAATTIASLLPTGSVAPAALATGIAATKLFNPYKFSAYRNAAWTSSNGSAGLVTFDTVEFDTSSNYSTSTAKFTAPVAGFYQFDAAVMAAMTSGSIYFASLFKNGTEFKRGAQSTTGATQNAQATVSTLVQLTATDYVQIFFQGVGGAGVAGQAVSYFQGFLVSTT